MARPRPWTAGSSGRGSPARNAACGKNARVSSRVLFVASPVAASSFIGVFAAFVACVPTGSAPPYDAGPTPAQTSSFKPSVGIMTAPFEDNLDRPDARRGAGAPGRRVLDVDLDRRGDRRAAHRPGQRGRHGHVLALSMPAPAPTHRPARAATWARIGSRCARTPGVSRTASSAERTRATTASG